MNREICLIRAGESARLSRLLRHALAGRNVSELSRGDLACGVRHRRLLFAIAVDEYGTDPPFTALVRTMRQNPDCLLGSVGGIIVDGAGELHTKEAAQELAFAANLAGCLFPGKSLLEGTGSLYNQHILARQMGCSLEETYFQRAVQLVQKIAAFTPPGLVNPRIAMLHASHNRNSNSLWMGREVVRRLKTNCTVSEICLRNGAVHDCRGCSYEACLHFAKNLGCCYGGVISEEAIPAIEACDAMLFLCPNYNDSVSANILALFNRLTNLLVRQSLSEKYLFGIAVSGYSGSDLIARQLLGVMCFNKTAILPPKFCLMQTANDPGDAKTSIGIEEKLDAFAARMTATLSGNM